VRVILRDSRNRSIGKSRLVTVGAVRRVVLSLLAGTRLGHVYVLTAAGRGPLGKRISAPAGAIPDREATPPAPAEECD
jgi:hypothetical protein